MSEVCELIQRGTDFKLDDIDGKAALFHAAKHNLPDAVWQLHQKGLDLNITDDEGKTAVYYANQMCSVGALCTLIRNGAKFKLDEIDGKAVLFYAAEHDFGWVIDQLRQKGLDFNITDDEGKTAAYHAIQNGNIDAFCEVISSSSFKLDTNDGKAALFYAAEHNLPQVVWNFNFDGFNLDITDDEGNTAVYYANQKCSVGALCELIDCGAEFELDEIDGKAALFYAVKYDGMPEVVRKLCQAGLDLNITDEEGKTAVYYANKYESTAALCALIGSGAEFELDEIDGKAALFYAAEQDFNRVIDLLYEAGLDLDITDDEGKTAVYYANQMCSIGALCALIQRGAEFELDEIDGKAALFHAAENDIDGVVGVLRDAGLDLDITDEEGKTALFYAVQQSGNKSMVRALIDVMTTDNDAKTDVMITDNDGKTALFYAVENDVIDVLIERDDIFINARDRYGRTALFDAVKRTTTTTARHLIAKGGNLQLKDKCNLSIFSFCVQNCILTNINTLQLFVSELFKEQQQLKALTYAIFDIIFSQAPLLCISGSPLFGPYSFWYNKRRVLDALDFARRQDFIQESDKGMIDEIKYMISKDTIHVSPILDLLNKLGANPNAADSDGNTALHYATVLAFFDVLPGTVMGICEKLRNFGAMFDQKNQNNQTPILFCLSSNNWKYFNDNKQAIRVLSEVCRFLLDNRSSINETSQSDESVLHLVMGLVKQGLKLSDEASRQVFLHEVIELLKCFSSFALKEGNENIVNKSDGNLNTPLHLWASFILPSSQDYTIKLTEDHTFKDILDIFLKCGAKLNLRNENEKTPLHLCKTWSAVKLLIDAGADPNVVDSSKGSPLLVAAKEKTYVINLDCFYPDVSEDPKIFWETSIDKGLDPWTADKQAESVLGILIESESFVLAKALVEVACEMNHIQSDSIKLGMLRVICQDVSRRTHWKTILVENILNSARKKRIAVDSPLRLCCRNIVQFGIFDVKQVENQESLQQKENDEASNDDGQPPSKKRRKEDENEDSNWEPVTYDSVHCTIVKQLRVYGGNHIISIRDTSGESCLDIAEASPALKDLLTMPIDTDSIPTLIPWTSVTDRYKNVLEKVAKQQECENVDQIWYHREFIGSGSFAHIFAGINEKDGREVAVKRIETLRMQGPQDKREIRNLTALADCQHVVRYVNFFQDEHFSYIVLELMEGDIDDYLKGSTYGFTKRHANQLCQDVVMGIEYLHDHNILHRDLKPGNILYNKKLCLKIADFGLSRRIDSTGSISVMSTKAGTRCWIAPEVLKSSTTKYSKSSDMFSCGLVLYYISTTQKHPFNPTDCATKSESQVASETEANIMNGNMEGWDPDNSLSSEATNLLKPILEDDSTLRPSAGKALDHPFFWSKKKRIDFLRAVGNQQEFGCPRKNRTPSAVETDLEKSITGTLVKRGSWDDSRFLHMPDIYAGMTTKTKPSERIRRCYTSSVVELVRFIRNVYEHFKEKNMSTTVPIEQLLLEDFVFLEYFPNLVMDVYNAVTTHGWDTRDQIKYAMDPN